MIRIVIKEPLKEPVVRMIPNSLEEMQNIVGGRIEIIPYKDGIDIYLNEEGKLLQLPPNLKLMSRGSVYDVVVGSVFFAKVNKKGETVSLELDECIKIMLELDAISIRSELEQQFYTEQLKEI